VDIILKHVTGLYTVTLLSVSMIDLQLNDASEAN
jgi:hypothetical protein